jgi:hypothetical protein
MKTIIASLKAKIEAEKKNLHKIESEKDRAFDLSMSLLREDKDEQGEQVYKEYVKKYDEFNESYNRLRCMRHALASLRDALHEEYDHFQPELDIQK